MLTAYIGPGAGIGLLWALLGLLAAIASAVFFVVLWPLRQVLRRRRKVPLEQRKAVNNAKDVSEASGCERDQAL